MALFSANSIHFILFLTLVSCAGGALAKAKLTHLHFYLHELYTGPNSTVAQVVSSPYPNSTFGFIGVFDDELRTGLDPTSPLIGRMQGFISQTSLDGTAYTTALNMVFTAGEYNGSTIAAVGNYLRNSVNERPVVGGSGKFRWATGYLITKALNAPQGTLILEIDVYVKVY